MTPEILITGAGVVSALGCGKAENLAALLAGRTGIGPLQYLKTSLRGFPGGEVPLSNEELSVLSGAPALWPRTSLLSAVALKECLQEAGLEDGRGLTLVGGTTVGGMDLTEQQFPKYAPSHGCGESTELPAHLLGFRRTTTISTACSSAANAIIFAANLIRSGKASCVVAGGSESLSNYHLNGFRSLMILDQAPCRPFDATRAGLNLGEGAAYLVLETAENARKRGVKALGKLTGFGNACDAFHQTASSEIGEGAFLAMTRALFMAGLKPEDIGYVNAHGTGTPNNDASESAALRRVFGEALPPVSSTKPFTGHTTSASGSIELVFCLLALQEGFLPGQLNWNVPDPSCIVPCPTMKCRVSHILSNAFGFGGNDSALILSRV